MYRFKSKFVKDRSIALKRQTPSKNTEPLRLPSVVVHNDEEIQALRRANAFIPISALPDVLLEYIFLFNVLPDPQASRQKTKPVNCALDVSWVCHHWRTIALSYPLLWTYCLDFDKSEGPSLELLDRSHPCPIDAYSDSVSRQSFVKLITGRAPARLRKICIDLDRITMDRIMAFLQVKRPSLEAFRIYGSEEFSHEYWLLPAEMLANACNLRELVVNDYAVLDPRSLQMSTRCHLVQLTVHQYEFTDQVRFPLSQWLAVLLDMQSLVDLDLQVSMRQDTNATALNGMLCSLPNLNQLKFGDDTLLTAEFLQRLLVPKLNSLSLTLSDNTDNPPHSSVMLFISEFVRGWDKEPPKIHRPILIIYHQSLFFQSWCDKKVYFTPIPYLSITLYRRYDRESFSVIPFTKTLLNIVDQPVFRAARHLQLAIQQRLKTEEGRSLLSTLSSVMQNIQILEIGSACRTRSLAHMLKYWNQKPLVHVPNLSAFEFTLEEFYTCRKKKYLFETVIEFIRGREEAGSKMQYVSIPRTQLGKDQLDRLRALVEVKGGKFVKPKGHFSDYDSVDSDEEI